MLNTDMGLIYGLNFDGNFKSQCDIPPLSFPPTMVDFLDLSACGEVFTGEEVHEYSDVCKNI
jgi:hypothetical protein